MNTGKTLFAQLMDFLPWGLLSRGSSTGMAAIMFSLPGPDAFPHTGSPCLFGRFHG